MELVQGKLVRYANQAPDRRRDLGHRDPQQKLHRLAALLASAKIAGSYRGPRGHVARLMMKLSRGV